MVVKKAFNFAGGSLEVKNESGVMQIVVTDTTGTPHTLNIPKAQSVAVADYIASVAKETQLLTDEQQEAIAKRWDTMNKNGQPF